MAKDPYKFFRVEAREILDGLSQGVLELEKGTGGKDTVGRLLRLAHTLKGASRVVKQAEIAELAHAMEDGLAPYREGQLPVPQKLGPTLLKIVDAIATRIQALELAPTSQNEAPSRPLIEERFETVRVSIREVDQLLEGVSGATAQLTAIRREADAVERTRRLATALSE